MSGNVTGSTAIYEINTPNYRTIFDEAPSREHHQLVMTRQDTAGGWLQLYNTEEECVVQIICLTKLLYGSRHERIASKHHVFDFSRINDAQVRIRCETCQKRVDDYTIDWLEVPEWIRAYSRCIWNCWGTPDVSTIKLLLELQDQLVTVLGEVPPFLKYPVAVAPSYADEAKEPVNDSSDAWVNWLVCFVIAFAAFVGFLDERFGGAGKGISGFYNLLVEYAGRYF